MSRKRCGGGEHWSCRWGAPAQGVQPHLHQWVQASWVLCLLSVRSLATHGRLLPGAGDLRSSVAVSWPTELFLYLLVHTTCGPGQENTSHSQVTNAEEFCLFF